LPDDYALSRLGAPDPEELIAEEGPPDRVVDGYVCVHRGVPISANGTLLSRWPMLLKHPDSGVDVTSVGGEAVGMSRSTDDPAEYQNLKLIGVFYRRFWRMDEVIEELLGKLEEIEEGYLGKVQLVEGGRVGGVRGMGVEML